MAVYIRPKKPALIIAVVLMALLLCFSVSEAIFLLRFHDFYDATDRFASVPGTYTGFVPQGIEYLEQEEVFLLSGYSWKNKTAHIYIIRKNKTAVHVTLLGQDGAALKSHAGGVCVLNGRMYLAGGDGYCHVFNLQDVLSGTAMEIGKFETYNTASFCCTHDGMVFVGEFYSDRNYFTDESHHLETPFGSQHKAIMFAFSGDENSKLGVDERPAAAYSIGNIVQGVCFIPGGYMVTSTSRNLFDSQLTFYDFSAATTEGASFTYADGMAVPLYYIDKRFQLGSLDTLPKAEEVTYSDGKLYVLFESAAERFQYGKALGAQYIYSLDIDTLSGGD
jgi:hypothetical protein